MFAIINEQFCDIFERYTKIPSYPLKPFRNLDDPVSSHADMLFCLIEDHLFCYNEYLIENLDLLNKLKESKYKIVTVKHKCERKYPNDIALNVLVVNKTLFCNAKYTATEIIEYAKSKNYKIVSVKQGYASCSTLVIDGKYAITADKGMKKALDNENIETLLIDNEGIQLSGYNYGFIGGASFSFENKVYFFGNLQNHPSGENIKLFLTTRKIDFFEVTNNQISDFGGIKIL